MLVCSNKYRRNKLKIYFGILIATSFVSLLVVYSYKRYLKVRNRSTDFNANTKSKQCLRMNLGTGKNKPSIAASFGGGRTANQLCEFASGYALWRQFGILNYIDLIQYNKLGNIFELPKTLTRNQNNSSYYIWDEGEYWKTDQ